LFRLQHAGSFNSRGTVWGWTIPLHHPQLQLRSLANPRGDDWISVDRPDGRIDLQPHLTTPSLVPYQQELLGDLRLQLAAIVEAWCETLIAVGRLRVIPVPQGCWVTIHPDSDTWERSIWVPVDWPSLIGSQSPREDNAYYDWDQHVAVLGTEDKQMRIDLVDLLWPDVWAHHRQPVRTAVAAHHR